MTKQELTASEKRYLEDLRTLPASIRSRIFGWALELVPSVGLFVFGLIRESQFFEVAGFLSLLYFAVWRMYSQLKGFRLLHGIYAKQLSAGDEKGA